MSAELKATVETKALGQKTVYPKIYDRALLEPISRERQRTAMKLPASASFVGLDVWNAYELSWMDNNGKPMRALASFMLDCMSPYLPESKSVKLYLNSLNHQKFSSKEEVAALIEKDLSVVTQSTVQVHLNPSEHGVIKNNVDGFYCIDELLVTIDEYQYNPGLLKTKSSDVKHQKIMSHLFKSHCLCTGQPDWGSIFIDYEGIELDCESVLKYLISFSEHNGFSENCIEQIYCDLMTRFKPSNLMVFGKFSRRGGIDITPYRANKPGLWPKERLIFQ